MLDSAVLGWSCGDSAAARRPSPEWRLPHEYGDGSTSWERSVFIGAGFSSLFVLNPGLLAEAF